MKTIAVPNKLTHRKARAILAGAFPNHTVSVQKTLWASRDNVSPDRVYSSISIGLQPGLDGSRCQHLFTSYTATLSKAVKGALAHPDAQAYLATPDGALTKLS